MIKPSGLGCRVAYPYALAILCPVASVALLIALCSLPRLSSHLCCHRRYLNLACLHASPRPQHLSHCLLALLAYVTAFSVKLTGLVIIIRRDVSKNETFWHDSDPLRIFSTSSRGLWAFPRALTNTYGIPTSFVVEPACATVNSPQSEV
jgi:hypothetical protein